MNRIEVEQDGTDSESELGLGDVNWEDEKNKCLRFLMDYYIQYGGRGDVLEIFAKGGNLATVLYDEMRESDRKQTEWKCKYPDLDKKYLVDEDISKISESKDLASATPQRRTGSAPFLE